MKRQNKKEKELEAKKKRKKELEAIKAKRRGEPILERNKPTETERPTILIVCEGKNTEPSYFKQFRLSSAIIKPIGEGYNTISLVKRTIQLSQSKNYDQVWCVFDKDDFSNNDFNNAIHMAASNNFGVAYSNQAFEYWLILHLDDHQGGSMHRNLYDAKINNLLKPFGVIYDGKNSKMIEEDFFEVLDGVDTKTGIERKILAITRAKRNYAFFAPNSNPAQEESSTTVFRLVEELLKYI